MLSSVVLAQYKSMSPRERIAEMCELLLVASGALELLPPEERAFRLAAQDRIRRASIDALLAGLAAAEEARDPRHGG